MGLGLEVRQEELRHRPQEADMHVRDRPLLHRVDRDAEEAQLVEQLGDVGQLAPQPI
jgi:hypothetical protein